MIDFHRYALTDAVDFDRLELRAYRDSHWLTLEMKIGCTENRAKIVIRNHEQVRDLHYALGRYIALMDAQEGR